MTTTPPGTEARGRLPWLLLFFLLALLIPLLHGLAVREGWLTLPALRLSYALAYAAFAAVVIGCCARFQITRFPLVWRYLGLLAGLLLGAIDVNLHPLPPKVPAYLFAHAVLGASLVVVLGRFLPAALRRAWMSERGEGTPS